MSMEGRQAGRAVAFLMRMPFLAPMAVPTATAVGVARPSASGQAMTTAVTASISAKRAVCPITKNQMRNVSSPALTAARTNYSAARSARCWVGGRSRRYTCEDQTYYQRQRK